MLEIKHSSAAFVGGLSQGAKRGESYLKEGGCFKNDVVTAALNLFIRYGSSLTDARSTYALV